MSLTDNEWIKIYNAKDGTWDKDILIDEANNIINRQKAENKDLFYKLEGVMHSVDKWLDSDELKQDEVNRAATMREKTLQIVEQKQAEIEKLRAIKEVILDNYQNSINEVIQLRAEIERLQKENESFSCLGKMYSEIKAEAIKEFAERFEEELGEDFFNHYPYVLAALDILVQEMVGD